MGQSTKPVEPAAGYSGTPLPRKLGIKAGSRVCFPGAPGHFLEIHSVKTLKPGKEKKV